MFRVWRAPANFATYVIGLLATGLVIGFYSGASGTSVVNTVLPLLFAVIGGVGGFYLTTVHVGNYWQVRKLGLLGLCFISFSLSVLAGTFWGASIRTGQDWRVLAGLETAPATPPLIPEEATTSETLALALLNARSKSLGLAVGERQALVRKAHSELQEKRFGLSDVQIDAISGAVRNVEDAVSVAEATGFQNDYIPLQEFAWRAALLGGMKSGGGQRLVRGQSLYVGELNRAVRAIVNNPVIAEFPPDIQTALVALYQQTEEAANWLGTVNWAGQSLLTEEVDAFVRAAQGLMEDKAEPDFLLVDDKNRQFEPDGI